jgi:6,7-dimethyl-8-ribityllumazine synthase
MMAEPRRSAGTDPTARDASELAGARLLIVEARFYEDIADALLAGAKRALSEAGVVFDCVSVPGSLEVAPAIAIALDAGERAGKPYEGVIALGCVIRGETSHYDIVCNNANHWLMELAVRHAIPLGNAILTVDTEAQALARARGGREGKGADAVRACLALIALERVFADEDLE